MKTAPGCRLKQLHDVLGFDRQVANLIARKRVAQAGIGRIDLRALRHDAHCLGDARPLQKQILPGGRLDEHWHVRSDRRLEAVQFDLDGVGAGPQTDEPVRAAFVRRVVYEVPSRRERPSPLRRERPVAAGP